ncbi:restriction endonuclease subunit S [Comamonadaceae bacterium OTU4NAUVB1]|nr:restriction endonuclease subunit S [Comamonadaceae bacterium OTU4NAUVB1]
MSNKSEAALVPRLRFPEFGDAALQSVLLGDVTEECRSRNGNKHSVTSVMGVTKADGIVPMEARLISPDIARYKLVERDWFAYNPMRLNIGSIARWKGDSEILVSPDYVVFKCIKNGGLGIAPDYLDHFRQIKAWEQFVTEGGDGSVRVRIHYKDIARIGLTLPSFPEQQKIADCLSSLDELIAAQARKLDVLKTHKKGLMQQLFPREGEIQPRLRFPEFQNSSKWMLDALENLCSAKISYGIVQAGPHVPGGMPYIKSSDLNSDICLETLSCTSELIAEKYRRSEVLPGDIVFSLRGNIGICRIVPDEISCANLTQGTARLRAKGSAKFLLQLIQSQRISDRILAASKGSTFQEISLGILRTIPIVFPELDEQRRIADCLTGLDHFISVQTQELETLKTHKKGLMQQLFPSSEAVEA